MRLILSPRALHLITGAAITQILLVVMSANLGGTDLPGLMPAGFLSGIDGVHLLLFGVFDLVGGIGFAALLHRQPDPSPGISD